MDIKTLKSHVKRHKQRKSEFLFTCLLSGFSYKCKLCNKLMLCERSKIHNHMKKVHGVVIYKKINSAITEKRFQYENLCKSFKETTPISFTFWGKNEMPATKVPIQERSSNIGNLCEYKCPKCEIKNIGNWQNLVKHQKRVHSLDVTLVYNPSWVSMARCHLCLICPKAVLSDRYFLGVHVYVKHKMTLQEYERIYLKYGGKVLPTFFQWKRTQIIGDVKNTPGIIH